MDELSLGLTSLDLTRIEREAGSLAELWDGDEPGYLAEQAKVCNDIVEACQKLNELLDKFVHRKQ